MQSSDAVRESEAERMKASISSSTKLVNSVNSNGVHDVVNGNSDKAVLPTVKLSQDEQDVVRLIGQHLLSLGLNRAAEELVHESGCMLEHPIAVKFKVCVLEGNWDKAETLLSEFRPMLKSEKNLKKIRFLILEQKYLELIEDNKEIDALICLRNEITSLKYSIDRVHELSRLIMCSNKEDLRIQASWDGKGALSRQKLMDKLQGYIPPTLLLPPNRLRMLLRQAMDLHRERCLINNTKITEESLLADHSCNRHNLPCITKQILTDHSDQVWYVQFSHDGQKLATGSKDTSVIIWRLNNGKFEKVQKFKDRADCVSFLAWSPDDKYLLICGPESVSDATVLNVETGEVQCRVHNYSEDQLMLGDWTKDGQKFVVAGPKGQFYECNLEGTVLKSWDGVRVQGLRCHKDGKTVLAADTHMRIKSYNFADKTDRFILQEDHPIMSFDQCKSGRYVVLNMSGQGLHLWDIKTSCLVRKFRGVKQGNDAIFSCFGGIDDSFVASGSEDHEVYIFHVRHESPVAVLSGHTKTVNCVSWNSNDVNMIASASDDGTVRIWGPSDSDNEDECTYF
ncbi:WD repeat-containing protein 26 [Trichoplax sp. H2]|nr:WD repeat-containing protein 26 [Trichoplax sp. H2]|eukprot:RDD37740.1 WD repeat-containing protein 26 [Trichoplax sp. H2]